MSSNDTNSTGCVDPKPTTETWVLLGVFLLLAFFSRIFTVLIFRGISGGCRRFNANGFETTFRKLFLNPVAALICLLFVQLAWQVAPWLCALSFVKDVVSFVILCIALLTVWILTSRLFEFAEIFVKQFNLGPTYAVPFKEGLRVTKLAVLFFLGIIFFSLIVNSLDSQNQFSTSLFFASANIISISFLLFFVPVIRDAVGGLQTLADLPFELNDWLEIDGARGTVERIGLFSVAIRSLSGAMTMIANSRFIESMFIVHRASRRRVVDFCLPLQPKQEVMTVQAQRSLIAEVERALFQLGLADLFVSYDAINDSNHALEIRFVMPSASSVELQVAQMNDAIIQVVKTVRG